MEFAQSLSSIWTIISKKSEPVHKRNEMMETMLIKKLYNKKKYEGTLQNNSGQQAPGGPQVINQ